MYSIKIVSGTFKGDSWHEFETLQDCLRHIVSFYDADCGDLVKWGTIRIYKNKRLAARL